MNKTNIIGLCILILLVIIPISYSYEEKHGDEVAENLIDLHKVKGVDKLSKTIISNKGAKGFLYEAKAAKKYVNDVSEVSIDLSKKIGKNGDIGECKFDWFRLDKSDLDKWAKTTNEWSKQIAKYKEYISKFGKESDKIIYMFNDIPSSDIQKWLSKNNVLWSVVK